MEKDKVVKAELVESKATNEDKVTEENWQGLTNRLGGMIDELGTVVASCKILDKEPDFDKEVVQGYWVSAGSIRKEILVINAQIQDVDKTDAGLGVLDYVSLLSEVTHLETLLAALLHDSTTDLIASDIKSNSSDLGKDLDAMTKLGVDLLQAKNTQDEAETKKGKK